ncbi:acyltransferase family protein [Latilactobacillus sakei]|uniref:acyltransferase family protein n=1 Tax=Latilactobacillus sakei TaxID=1599 RepID=UPI003F53B472
MRKMVNNLETTEIIKNKQIVKKTRNSAIDIYRLFAAIFVVMIHTAGDNKSLLLISGTIGRVSVPFFMMISGYFIFRNGTGNRDKISKTIKHLFSIWIFWNIVYLPLDIYHFKGIPIKVAIHAILKVFFSAGPVFGGSWYLLATIVGVWTVHKFFNRFKWLLILGSLFYFLATVFFGGYGSWITQYPVLLKLNNYVSLPTIMPIGIVWVLLGKLIADNYSKIKLISNTRWYLLLICSLSMLVIEYVVVNIYKVAFINLDGHIRSENLLL